MGVEGAIKKHRDRTIASRLREYTRTFPIGERFTSKQLRQAMELPINEDGAVTAWIAQQVSVGSIELIRKEQYADKVWYRVYAVQNNEFPEPRKVNRDPNSYIGGAAGRTCVGKLGKIDGEDIPRKAYTDDEIAEITAHVKFQKAHRSKKTLVSVFAELKEILFRAAVLTETLEGMAKAVPAPIKLKEVDTKDLLREVARRAK